MNAPKRRFKNPIIPGFHPDPSICRVGGDFYLVTSSFEYFPGVPLFHSKDLVHFRLLGHVLTRDSQLDLRKSKSSNGIYAPTLRHDGRFFYMVTTHIDGGGNFFVTAERPEGPWSEPVWLDRDGIDPSFSFIDGTAYYTRTGKGSDFDHPLIYQGTLDKKARKISVKPEPIWPGTGGIWPEAPHLFKRGEYFYLMHAEGGTHYDHSEIVVRSRSPFGPFEVCPHGPILGHRARKGHAIQATGHADLVELANGETWAVFLAVRPKGGRFHHLGRETFLAPVTWTKDGWPVIGNRGHVELEMTAPRLEPAPFAPLPARDDFDARPLAPAWNFVRNPNPDDWSLAARPGHLRLIGSKVSLDELGSPALVARRQQHFAFRARARLDFEPKNSNEEAGLAVRANEDFYAAIAITRGAAGREATLRTRLLGKSRLGKSAALEPGPVELEITATAAEYEFFVLTGTKRVPLGTLACKELSTEKIWRPGHTYFTGAFVVLYATGNGSRSNAAADFDWFDYAPGDD
ncbi:MAG TPA: glycoside hydrolase family 43 protein [Polyangiaceae bacterium]